MRSINKKHGAKLAPLVAGIIAASLSSTAAAQAGGEHEEGLASLIGEDGFTLAPGLTMKGFIDMSYNVVDPDDADKDENAGIDQWEIQLTMDFGQGLTAHTDIEWHDNGGDDGEEMHLEQAYLNYQINVAPPRRSSAGRSWR